VLRPVTSSARNSMYVRAIFSYPLLAIVGNHCQHHG
jgi:hypothetical protein